MTYCAVHLGADVEKDIAIVEARGRLLANLRDAVRSLGAAETDIAELRSGSAPDIEFIEGRDGNDMTVLLDQAIRRVRATYAVAHMVIDRETPR